jgi:hypothetical protein
MCLIYSSHLKDKSQQDNLNLWCLPNPGILNVLLCNFYFINDFASQINLLKG